MRFSIPKAVALGLSCLVFSSVVQADDLEDLKRKIVAAKEEAAELRDLGKLEEAEATDREVDELTAEAKRIYSERKPEGNKGDRKKEAGQNHPELRQLKERLHDLHAAMKKAEASDASEEERHGLREKITHTERELAQAVESMEQHPRQEFPPQFREQAEKLEMAARRVHHIRAAAENLKAAEMHDLAHELMEKAEAMQHEIHAARTELAEQMRGAQKHHEPEHGEEFRELKGENERLRQELNELRNAVEQLRGERKRD